VFDRAHPSGVLDVPAYSGEIGHLVVDTSPDAPVCGCGGRGHLGTIASGRGIEHRARERAAGEPISFESSHCRRLGSTAGTLNNEDHIVPAARALDPWVCDVIRECTRPLAATLAATTLAVGLERIVVFGGFPQAIGTPYLDILREEIGRLSDYPLLPGRLHEQVELAEAGTEVCLHGAALFAAQVLRTT